MKLAGNDANLLDKIKVAAAAGTPKTITFGSRKLTREVWAAMVLPFETTVTEVSKALGYAVVDILDVTENSNDMHLKLHMGKINANQPFIVKYYKEDVEEELYTEATANEHNATLTGAKHEGDLKTAAIPASYVPVPNGTTLTLGNTYYTDDQGNGEFQANGTEVSNGTNYFTYQAEVVATYYTSAQAAEYNANLNGAKHAGDVKVAAVNNSTLDLSELAATAFVNKIFQVYNTTEDNDSIIMDDTTRQIMEAGKVPRHESILSKYYDSEKLDMPFVVLCNQYTASASEIFAAAIQDYEAAPLVGTTTFGKGITQRVVKLTDGSAVKYTDAELYSPKGHVWHKKGLTPDVESELAEDATEDTQLLDALEYFKRE